MKVHQPDERQQYLFLLSACKGLAYIKNERASVIQAILWHIAQLSPESRVEFKKEPDIPNVIRNEIEEV